ncbi:MAG: hypothetical protein VZQ27_05105 [Candidatus Cryptobacteroides sp.]|nr:hypothetical protein [Candidatus Cryptobacteroides sp.]
MKIKKTSGWLAFTIVIALVVFICPGFSTNKSYGEQGQQDKLLLSPPIEPTFVKDKKYQRLNKKNIDAFIQDWKGWSLDLRTFSTDSVVNQAINRIMSECSDKDMPDNSIFYSMPCCIEISRYQGSFPPIDVNDEYNPPFFEETQQALERFAYVPGFDSDKVILYMTPEIEKLLSRYLGGIRGFGSKVNRINKGREAYLSRFFYVHYGHWGGYWILHSMPKIIFLSLYDDGICAYLRTSWCTGETVFVPFDTAKELVRFDYWIE